MNTRLYEKDKRKRAPKGFTLVELMVAVTVLMVLVVATGTGIFGSDANTDRKAAATEFANIVDFAKVRAMARGVAFMVRIRGIGSSSYSGVKDISVYRMSSNVCSTPAYTAKPVKQVRLSTDYPGVTIGTVTIDGVAISSSTVYFCVKPDGTVRDSSGSLPSNTGGNVVEVTFRTYDIHGGTVGAPLKAVVPYIGSPRLAI